MKKLHQLLLALVAALLLLGCTPINEEKGEPAAAKSESETGETKGESSGTEGKEEKPRLAPTGEVVMTDCYSMKANERILSAKESRAVRRLLNDGQDATLSRPKLGVKNGYQLIFHIDGEPCFYRGARIWRSGNRYVDQRSTGEGTIFKVIRSADGTRTIDFSPLLAWYDKLDS